MVHRSTLYPQLLAAVALTFTACGGSNVSNASPRVDEVPLQSTTGAGEFTFDLGGYVSDREGSPLTYAVTDGGGSFAGSIYSNTFATMGDYTVAFTVSDGSKTTAASFPVRVTQGNFVVVREDNDGLLLLDSRTEAFVRVASAASSPTLVDGLGDGRLVYQLGSAPLQLWVFDPLTRQNTRVVETATGDVIYRATTADGKLLFTTGSGNDMRLFYYNPSTGFTRDVAQDLLGSLTVVVDSDGIVFFEVGVNGQADIYAYDPTEDEVFAVGTAATDEQIQAAVPSGGVVFTRLGTGGEADLFCYRTSAGLVELGTEVSGLPTRNKVFHVCGTLDQVVFSAQNGGDTDLFAWNAANGQTTTVASGGVYAYDLLGAGNELVYHQVVSGSEQDVFFRDLDSGLTGTVRDNSDISQVVGVTNDGVRDWVFLLPSGTATNIIAVSLVASPVTVSWAAGGNASASIFVLPNGDVVTQNQAGTRIGKFNADVANWGTDITGTGLFYRGEGLAAGDYVFTRTVSAQTDLEMFDDSADAAVVISNETGDDTFQARTADGTVLFTRSASGNTNADLFVWDGATVTRLTGTGNAELCDHAVLFKYAGVR
ncbi:MAG: hypothetical protein MUC36_14080 [Planctomycetes bacterium]|jgi:hypothetical protein|nr:hypothetical protein [Planctomycetota bacterium]